jgi:hypothetical protein
MHHFRAKPPNSQEKINLKKQRPNPETIGIVTAYRKPGKGFRIEVSRENVVFFAKGMGLIKYYE